MPIINITDHWNEYLDLFKDSEKDIYYLEEYVRLYETADEVAQCFVYLDEGKCFLFPYLLRHFDFNGKTQCDFETAYGYGGPIVNCTDQDFIDNAIVAFKEYGMKNGYVSGFVRFHPLLKNESYCQSLGRIIPDRSTIAINLSLDIEDIWRNEIHSQNRNVIKKGEKNGLRFIADNAFKYIEDFERLYNSTMDKLSADNFYYFDETYYKKLKDNINNAFLGVVLEGNEPISAAIFFQSGQYGHYHLSGSNRDKLRLCPNNYLIWEAAKELKNRGASLFHLGGGTNSDEDNSLFLFKKKFSKTLFHFSIGKIIFNDTLYNSICSQWAINNPEKVEKYKHFLLKYKY